ncbi:MAG: class I adenylate-forming enzyme family protein [Oliverpabstia sp.]
MTGKIYDGNQLWTDSICEGLIKRRFGNETYDFYEDMPKSLYTSLVNAQKKWPDRYCIVDDMGISYTYSQFLDMVENFARVLFHTYHVTPGMHIGILLYNSIEFCVSVYAINRLGAVAVPFSTKYRQPEIDSLIEKADLNGLIFDKDYVQWFPIEEGECFLLCLRQNVLDIFLSGSILPGIPREEIKAEDSAVLMFTSGTTSRSKGVLMANYNIMHAIAVYQRIFHITEYDKTVLPVPAYHVTGLIAVIGLFIHAGGCIWLHKFFNAVRVLREMKENFLTFFHASPTVFSLLLEHKEEFPNIPYMRIFACGSSNMPKEKIKKIKEWMPQAEFRTVYGLTETTSPATIFPDSAAESSHIGSSGRPIPGMQFAICDELGSLLRPRETGSVMVKGTTVTMGYYKMENRLEDGWLDTGDIGYFDEESYLYLVDRKKDMINRGGEKVCSFDVENVLYGISGIQEAAVVGIPDDRYGEVPAAMIVADEKSDLTAEKIKDYLKTKLAGFQIPVKVLFSHSLPMTSNMKIDKKRIRELLAQN